MNIFVIDKETNENQGIIKFIPRIGERISISNRLWEQKEYIVDCVFYEPRENTVIVFAVKTELEYSKLVSKIKWK